MTDHHHPGPQRPEPPTTKQQRELRRLASRTGQSFTPPRTKAEASAEIRRLRASGPSPYVERRLERSADVPAYGTAVRDDETTGYGQTAHWA